MIKRKLLFLCLLLVNMPFVMSAERFECVADGWIYKNDPGYFNNSATVEIQTSNGDITGLFGFNYELPESKRVKNATLHLITERFKGGTVDLYGYPHNFEENTNWTNEESYISGLNNKIVTFTPAGEYNKSIMYDQVSEEYKELAKWTNDIDVTGFVKTLGRDAGRVNFLMNNTSSQICFFSKDNTGITDFSKEELMPYLIVEFEEIPNIDHAEFNCIADTWLWEKNPNSNFGSAKNLELQSDDDLTRRILYGFNFNVPEGKKISTATLHIVTERFKGSDVDVYGYTAFDESTATWNTEMFKVPEAESKGKIATFTPAGHKGKAIFDENIKSDCQSLEAWTNDIDVSEYVKSLKSSVSEACFMLYATGGQTCFYSKENEGQQKAFNGTDAETDFDASQLMPYLIVTYDDEVESGAMVSTTAADTQVWKNTNKDQGSLKNMEIYTMLSEGSDTELDREFYGLLRFDIPGDVRSGGDYEVESANLRLVCTQFKGDKNMQLFDYTNVFAENTDFSKEETFIREALAAEPSFNFEAKGQSGRAMWDGNYLTDATKTVDGWTSNIDITEYLKGKIKEGATTFGFLLKKRDNNSAGNGNAVKFATKEAEDEKATLPDGEEIVFAAGDLVPQLTINFKKKEITEEPEPSEPEEKTVVMGIDYYTTVTTSNSSANGSSTAATMIIDRTPNSSGTPSEVFGLLKITMPSEVMTAGNFKITQAKLRLVCTELREDPTIDVYGFGYDFRKGVKYENESTNIHIEEVIQGQPVAQFNTNGVPGHTIYEGSYLTDETKKAEGWTSYIDLTDYFNEALKDNKSYVTLLLRRHVELPYAINNHIVFATPYAQTIESWDDGGWNRIATFPAADLVPRLTLSYVAGEEKETPYYLTFEPISDTEARVVKCYDSPEVTEAIVPETVTLDGVTYKVTEIGEKAFYQNKNVRKVSLPDCIRVIGTSAFDSASAMEEINMPSQLELIKDWAFYSCTASNDVVIPAGVTSIERFGLASTRFKTIDLSQAVGITKIEERVFSSTSATKIILPPYLEEIGEEAFYSAGNLSSLEFPETLRKLGKQAFYRSEIEEFFLPEGVEEIPQSCFYSANLKKIHLPSTLVNIGNNAFSTCRKMETVVSNAVTPPTGDITFYNNGNDKYNSVEANKLYVPHAGYDAYLEEGWNKYFQYIYCLEDEFGNYDHIVVLDGEEEISPDSEYLYRGEATLNFQLHPSYLGYYNTNITDKDAAYHFTLSVTKYDSQNGEEVEFDYPELKAGMNTITFGSELEPLKRYLVKTVISNAAGEEVVCHEFIIMYTVDLELHGGHDYFLQSENPDKGDYDIWIDSLEETVGLFLRAPEGSEVYYRVYDVKSVNGDDNISEGESARVKKLETSEFQKAELSIRNMDTDSHEITVSNNTEGKLDAYFVNNNTQSPVVTYSYKAYSNTPVGIEDVKIHEADAEYFTLQGIKVINPEKGIYIKVESKKVSKVIL